MSRDPIGGVIANLITLQRLGNMANVEAKVLLGDLFDDLAAQIAKLDPTAPERERYRRQRIEALLGEVDDLVGERFREVRKTLRARLAGIGAQQAQRAGAHLGESIGSVAIDIRTGRVGLPLMRSILDNNPFEGETLRGWVETQAAATVRRVRRQLQLGMTQNETLDQLVRRVRGRHAGGGRFVGGVLDATTRDTEAIVRTGVNFIANRAHQAVYQANADILEGMEVVAVLDMRTTPICMSKDGQVLPLDSTDVPPYHYGCRTILVAKIAWERLGIEPPDPGTRASMGGQVKSSITYEGWLKNQPAGVQNEILGPGRASLFREGKVGLRDLVREDRSLVSLEELRRKAQG